MDTQSNKAVIKSRGFQTPEVDFYFDLIDPYAFIASERLDDIAKFTGAKVTWKPVLLSGLYELTNAQHCKAGKITLEGISKSKKKILTDDFYREIGRYQLPLKFPPNHPLPSADVGLLLCAFPEAHRPALAHALFRAYWYEGANIGSRATLLRIARSLKLTSIAAPTHSGPFSLTPTLNFPLDESIFSDARQEEMLNNNTKEAFNRGAFGVPSFWIEERQKLFWGQDRMHLLEAELISIKLSKPVGNIRQLERLHPRCLRTPPEDRVRRLRFWFDFSSRWSYLGWNQLERIQRDAGPGLIIELMPFHLGALWKEIGTPEKPMSIESEQRQKYATKDLLDWVRYWQAVNSQEYPPIDGPDFKPNDISPLSTAMAMRVAILEPKTVPAIFKAAWSDNLNIGDEKVLTQVLDKAGFQGSRLIMRSETVSSTLRSNTAEASRLGLCGSPTYQICKVHAAHSGIGGKASSSSSTRSVISGSTTTTTTTTTSVSTSTSGASPAVSAPQFKKEDDGILVFGQDKLNQVQDLVLGWKPNVSKLKASVAAFPHYDYRL